MSLIGAQPMSGRRARRILDGARNPGRISLHAVERFIQDAQQFEGADAGDGDPTAAKRAILCACRAAKKIYRGSNSYVLQSLPWWIFYRDGTVVTVLHDRASGNFQRRKPPPC